MRIRAIELDPDREEQRITTAEPVSDIVAALAATVRAVYINAVRMTGLKNYAYFGSPDKQGRPASLDGDRIIQSGMNRGHTGWTALASRLVQLSAPADLYIRAQFDAYNKTSRGTSPPFPTVPMLCGDWGAHNWEEYSRDRRQAVVWQMQSDQVQLSVNILPMVVNLGWSEAESVEYALGDRVGCVITPLTRYCTAYSHGMTRICQDAFRGALFQYLFEAVYYDVILGSSIPEPLRETARTVRRNLGL